MVCNGLYSTNQRETSLSQKQSHPGHLVIVLSFHYPQSRQTIRFNQIFILEIAMCSHPRSDLLFHFERYMALFFRYWSFII